MNARFLHPSARGASPASQDPASCALVPYTARADIANRACCCPAWAAVRVIMPATATRPHETELLLCGHHYRVSRHALAEAHAIVHELPWVAGDTAAWIGLH